MIESRHCKRALVVSAVIVTWVATSMVGLAQAHRLVPLDHWSYEYILRLQRRGHLLELHPTALPYTRGDIRAALGELSRRDLSGPERRWARRLADEFGRRDRRSRTRRQATIGGVLRPGLRLSDHTRLDPLRPMIASDPTLEVLDVSLFPNVAGQLFLEHGPVIAQAGLRFDVYYRDDPDGLDAANRLIVRNEKTYAGFGSRYFSAYLGRFQQHWAPRDSEALLISDNPVGVDHLNLRIGGRQLSLRSILGELDSITADGRYTGTAGADSVAGSERRFLAAHRFDWRPTRQFSLSLMESTVYSSATSGISLKFLNPLNLHAFAVDGRPKNDENNGLLAGMLWFQFYRLTVQGQLMIDDVDLMGQTGEPPSAALSGTLTYAGWPTVDIGGRLTTVTARAYNTHQPEGRYVHLLRGMGTQFSDFVQLSAFATVYTAVDGIDAAVTPKIDVLWQGERDLRQPYPRSEENVDAILTGTVTSVVRPGLEMRLQGGRSWWMNVDAGVLLSNQSAQNARFSLTAALATRIDVTERINLQF